MAIATTNPTKPNENASNCNRRQQSEIYATHQKRNNKNNIEKPHHKRGNDTNFHPQASKYAIANVQIGKETNTHKHMYEQVMSAT